MTKEEEKQLNQRAGIILRQAGLVFDEWKDYNSLRERGGFRKVVGFAHAYLSHQVKESKTDDEIDIQVYRQLMELDSRLGTTATEQLFYCVKITQRFDLIKV